MSYQNCCNEGNLCSAMIFLLSDSHAQDNYLSVLQ